MNRQKINIVCFGLDDDPTFRALLERELATTGVSGYKLFACSADMLAELHEDVHICIIDHMLDEVVTGIDVLIEVLKKNPFCFVIGMSAGQYPEVITSFVNNGGRRYLLKGDPRFTHSLCAFIQEGIDATIERFSDQQVFRAMMSDTDELLNLISSRQGT